MTTPTPRCEYCGQHLRIIERIALQDPGWKATAVRYCVYCDRLEDMISRTAPPATA